MSTILVIGFVAFVILGVVASLGGNTRQYERIGESALGEPGASGPVDESLAEEARQLVMARNRRLVSKGEPPLDVEAEVARTLAELTDHSRPTARPGER